jgi:hypothetical protein
MPLFLRNQRRVILLASLLLCGMIGVLPILGWAQEETKPEKYEFKDIYLRENQVCKACRLEWVDNKRVKLINRAGQAAIVPAGQVLGIDRHPIIRKAMLHSLHGVGLPGEVLVPAAFDEGDDFVCKYCDSFNKQPYVWQIDGPR